MKKIILQLTPPFLIEVFRKIKPLFKSDKTNHVNTIDNPSEQDLEVYWTDDMLKKLEYWGKGHVWNEIQCLMVNCKGKVLDIACGTGVNIKDLSLFPYLEVHGFDISDFFVKAAVKKGISPDFVKVQDATKTNYQDNEFDYSYSLGSLEHFTEEGIDLFLNEAARYTSQKSFHQIPVSTLGKNEGWIKRDTQSYFNNEVDWWLPKFQKHFSKVYVLPSGWRSEGFSEGKWFVCEK